MVVLEAAGLLDPVLADFLTEELGKAAEDSRTLAVVLRVDSPRALLSSPRLENLAQLIRNSQVPVVAWVGPSGARASGEVAQLLGVVERLGIAPGAWLGQTGPQVLAGNPWGRFSNMLSDAAVGHSEALEAGIVPAPAATVGDFLLTLEDLGFQSEVFRADSGELRRRPLTEVRFIGLPYGSALMHSVASPSVAYLLLLVALFLVILELYTAGVGIAGATAAFCGTLAAYGLVVLPVNVWAVVLIVFGYFAFAVDVQTGVPRLWTAVGIGSVIAGTLTLYDGVSMSWVPMLAGLVCLVLGVIAGLPPLVRTRFSTPTIGREYMTGMRGEAVEVINPSGVVSIQGALWRAKTYRASPIQIGSDVVVTGIEGLTLEVSPAEQEEEIS